MEIKKFKEGIAQLAALTNQRQKEPEPFAIQYGKDGGVSLLAANEAATIAWFLSPYDGPLRGRHGISSKMLYQAAKVLKGKGSVSFEFNEHDFTVIVDGGGRIKLPYEQQPKYHHAPDKRYDAWLDQTDLGRMRNHLDPILPTRENYVVATPLNPDVTVTVRLTASNGYVVWEEQTMPLNEIASPIAWRLDAMTSLKGLSKNSILSLGEHSVKVESEDFTMYTRLLREDEFIHYPSMKNHYYPEGRKPKVAVEVDRKALIAAIKAVAPDARKEKDQQFMIHADGNGVLSVEGMQHKGSVTVVIKKGYGTGSVALGAIYTLPVLNAFETASILMVFSESQNPVGFKTVNNPYESYLIAPVFKL